MLLVGALRMSGEKTNKKKNIIFSIKEDLTLSALKTYTVYSVYSYSGIVPKERSHRKDSAF